MISPGGERGPADLIERAVGALVGAAVGDALGAPFEFGPAGRLSAAFPAAVWTDPAEMVGGGEWEPAEWTDDTQMALLVAESLLACGGLDEADAFDRFRAWAAAGPKDIGVQTAAVLRSGMAWQEAAAEHFRRTGRAAGNGSLMRTAPAAIWFASAGTDATADAARRLSALTHGDPAAGDGCAIFHLLMAAALAGDDPLSAIDEALAVVPVERRDAYAERLTATYDPRRDPLPNGAVWPALGAAVWALRTTATFEEALRAAVDLGGDTDTVACITGALAGAVHTIGAIPSRWTTYVHGELVGRGPSGHDLTALEHLARSLVARRRLPPTDEVPAEPPLGPERVDPARPLYAANRAGVQAAVGAGRLPPGALVVSLGPAAGALAAHRPRRQVWLHDEGPNLALSAVLDDVVATIDAHLEAGVPVVVHCDTGRCRTGLALRAWLCAGNRSLDASGSLAEARRRWPHAEPCGAAVEAAFRAWVRRRA